MALFFGELDKIHVIFIDNGFFDQFLIELQYTHLVRLYRRLKMRKPNGYGSVYKMKGRLRNPWRVVTPKRKTIGYCSTRSEAEFLLAEYHNNNGKFESPTVEQIYKYFIRNKKFKTKSTKDGYTSAWSYFEDYWSEEIAELKTRHVQDIINVAIDNGKGFATCRNIKLLASQLFKIAQSDDYVAKDYSKFVTLPDKPEPDNRTFTVEEVERIFKGAEKDVWAKIFVLLVYTAMRPSELLNTKRKDVHLEERYLIAGSKTEAGRNRYIPIYDKIYPIVEWFMKNTEGYNLIVVNGSMVRYRYYLDKHSELIKKYNLQDLSPHKCRKTGATIYQNLGMDPLALQRMLGHQSFETTDKYYTGDVSESLSIAMKNIES